MNQGMSFGNYIRQRRRELDLTQDELARRVGCAAITLRKIEADDLRPSVQISERLAMALTILLDERADFVRRARAVTPEASDPPALTPAPALEEIGREDLTGRAIHGYALAERIGKGGMGSVYRAVQPNVEREVAVKIILPVYANHPDFIRRFEAEAQLVARLEHPHIVPLYDFWREPSVAYLIMRLLRGGSVQGLLGQGPLAIDAITRMLEQICSALNAAHRMGVIHRDLKPANVLLDEDNNAYLADFGIAKNISNPDMENLTRMDAMIGSPQYMSPEQIQSLSVRPQTDIYCLGIMLYEMLTGVLPFAGPTPIDLIQQHINTPMPPLSAHLGGLPAHLDRVVWRATAKNPDERYADTQSFYQDFLQAASGLLDARPVTIEAEKEIDIELTNPFKGLQAFGEADAENFFGREALVQQLLARMGESGDLSRFLAVIGPSGSGKSSVVRAGLIPALRRGGLPGSENWFIIDMLPGKHPFEELEASLLRVAVNPPEHLLSQMKEGSRGLLRAVQRILPADKSIELVLVIDQFEEVFTLVEDEAERALLLENLATAALDERSRLRVVITLRADFTDKPLRYVDFGELLNRRFEFVLPLTPDELASAILSPSQRLGLKLEKGLVSTIIREVGNQPGALPLMQFALSELFDRRNGRMLSNKAYQEIGGTLGALSRSAETIYAGLDEAGQSAARQLFLRLVTLGEGTEDTRRRVLREEIESLYGDHQPAIQKVIDQFGLARLLSFDHDPLTRSSTLEVAHEALIREWARLREWLTHSRADVRTQRQLNHIVQEWNSAQQDASFLVTGSRLEQFADWSAHTTIALTQAERTFLEASLAERDRRTLEDQARQKREIRAAQQLRQRAIFLTVVSVLAIGLAGIAIFFGNQANRNAAEANASEKISKSRELAAAAVSNLDIDPERSILLALQAESTVHTSEAENALHRSILASRVTLVLQHDALVNNVIYSPDGKRVATASADKTAKIWDAVTGQLLLTLKGHTDEVWGLAFSPDGQRLATSSSDQTAKVWDATSGEELFILPESGISIKFSPDGTRLVTTSLEKIAKVWDATSGKELLTLEDQDTTVYDVAFSPDGKRLATCGADGIAQVWDANSGKELLTLSVEGAPVFFSLVYSPDGTRIAAAGGDIQHPLAMVWDAATGKGLLSGSFGHTNALDAIAFSPDGTLVATVADDQKANIWDSATGQVLTTLAGHASAILNLAFSPDGAHLATASWDGTARLWDISPAKEALFIPFADAATSTWSEYLSYSPDGTRLLTDYTDGNARIWDAANGKELLQLAGPALYTAFSADGKLAAAGNAENTVIVWDTQTGKQRIILVGHQGSIFQVAFSPDGTRLASSSADGTVIIWDLASGQALFTLPGSVDIIDSVAFSPDGKYLVAGGGNFGSMSTENGYIWNAASGEKLLTLSMDGAVTAVNVSPDGKRVVLASFNGAISVLDALTGNQILTWRGHTGTIYQVAVSPDGKLLATASGDGAARVWDAASGVNLLTLPFDSGGGGSVSFSPDGKRLAVGGRAGISIFYLQLQDVIALAKSRVTRSLTLDECQQYLHVESCPGAAP
jgi:WD40 repeat protein/transcriptional regulator with XRE-family HTH domain